MLIVDDLPAAAPRPPRSRPWRRSPIVALSIYDLMGRDAYAIFMASSVITLCFLVEIAALVALRVQRAA